MKHPLVASLVVIICVVLAGCGEESPASIDRMSCQDRQLKKYCANPQLQCEQWLNAPGVGASMENDMKASDLCGALKQKCAACGAEH